MGLASKIKASAFGDDHSAGSFGAASAPAPAPALSRDHPQHAQQHGAPAPSALPFTKQTEPQQHYDAPYAIPYRPEGYPSPQSLYPGPPSARDVQLQPPLSTYGMSSHAPPVSGAPPSYLEPGAGGFGPAQYQHTSHPHTKPASTMTATTNMLAEKLQAIIQANGLQSFYDQAKFQAVLQKVTSINFAEVAAQWRLNLELAYDLAPLALYDIVFYCDDSGSMAFAENGERIDDLKFILSKVSGVATMFDDDGIIVRFMNSDVNGDGIKNAAEVAKLISEVRFSGMTPLGTNLNRKVIQPFVLGQAMSSMEKPVLAIVITDGEPAGEDHDTLRQVIYRAKAALTRTRYGGGALAVQIAQVGKDARTQKFLESLDNDAAVGGMIDCTSYYEMEEEEFARKGVTLTPELWLLKMCVGAIDPEYDSKDD